MLILNKNIYIQLSLYLVVSSILVFIVKAKSSDFDAYVEISPNFSVQEASFLEDVFLTGDGDLKLTLDETNTKYIIKGEPGFAVSIAVSQFADFNDIDEADNINSAPDDNRSSSYISPENIDFVLDEKTGEAIINLTGEIAIPENSDKNILKNVYIAINY
jgi:hypothetical protein